MVSSKLVRVKNQIVPGNKKRGVGNKTIEGTIILSKCLTLKMEKGTVRCMSSVSGVLSLDDVDLSEATQVSFLGEKCPGLYKCDL